MPPSHWLPFSVITDSKIPTTLAPNQHTPENTALWLPSILIFPDPLAAFDPVNHHGILMSFLTILGMIGSAWQWFASYLKGHSYQVARRESTSASYRLSTGVCKGSLLSPLLFTPCTYSSRWCNTTNTASTELCWWHLTDPFHPTKRLLIISWLVRQAPHESQLIILSRRRHC